MKANLHTLKLVTPPISNADAEKVKDIEMVNDILSQSHLYMICQRGCPRFVDPKLPPKDGYYPLGIEDQESSTTGYLKLSAMVDTFIGESVNEMKLGVRASASGISIFEADIETDEFVKQLGWIEPRAVLYLISTKKSEVMGFDNYADFLEYRLHYVGISKDDDSFKRLVVKPHDKRLRILSNEYPVQDASRVTDEVVLLFFRIEPLVIQVLDDGEDIVTEYDYIRIIADAEKAFVNILKSSYNEVKFKNYPQSTDGLYNTGLTRYGYLLGEEITLVTGTTKIRGDFSEYGMPNSDMIFIEGDKVELMLLKGLDPLA